jgi:hypothetical protein
VDCRASRQKNKPAGGFLPLLALPGPRPSEKSGVIEHQPLGVDWQLGCEPARQRLETVEPAVRLHLQAAVALPLWSYQRLGNAD